MNYIEVNDVQKQYGNGESAVWAVRGIRFSMQRGEWVAIMGESGSGKSTLLSVMGALNTPTSGLYRVDGIDVYSLHSEARADFRRNYLGFVFQNFHLMPYLTVEENVLLPLATGDLKRREKLVRAEKALFRVGLAGKRGRLPSQISGGEQERVAIARAIVSEPPILLADEPTGNLDSKTTREIMDLLRSLNASGMTIVMVTHNSECAQYAGKILYIADGGLDRLETPPRTDGTGLQRIFAVQ